MAGRTTRTATAIVLVILQAIAAVYFLIDGVVEGYAAADIVVGIGLLAGIAFGGIALRRLLAEADRRDQALAAARGALTAIMHERFGEWRLSPAEAEVALFALKGCPIGEIAAMRGAAQGTVRAQLSQVYGKAGVNGQPGLMALFLDELIEAPLAA